MSHLSFSGPNMFQRFTGDGTLTLMVSEQAPQGVEATISLRGRAVPTAFDLSREQVEDLGNAIDNLFASAARPVEDRISRDYEASGSRMRVTYLCDGSSRGIVFADERAPEGGVYLSGEELYGLTRGLLLLADRRPASHVDQYLVLPPVEDARADTAPEPPAEAGPIRSLGNRVLLALGPLAITAYAASILNRSWVPLNWRADMEDGAAGVAYTLVAGMIAATMVRISWRAWRNPTLP